VPGSHILKVCLTSEYLPEQLIYALAFLLADLFCRSVKNDSALLEEYDIVKYRLNV
jgi:hypothetical protein